ncbi:MAG: GNAT family N-acetyltransferase [Betaproteobacteria bacterium]
MNDIRVSHLAHTAPQIAEAIRAVMFQAYCVEAALLGVRDFAPLHRTAAHIAETDALFLGISPAGTLAAIAEVESSEPRHVHIGSLVVLPSHVRRGLATALIRHILDANVPNDITVSTGTRNQPAIQLYTAHGFREHRLWTTNDGIRMVTLRRAASSAQPAV